MEWLSNFGMREWLLSCGVILVMVVLFDGFRRMRNEQKNTIKMSRRMGGGYPDTPVAEPFASELPNGGARVVGRDGRDGQAPASAAPEAAQAAVDDFHDTLSGYDSPNSESPGYDLTAYDSPSNDSAGSTSPSDVSLKNESSDQASFAVEQDQAEPSFVSEQQILVLHAKSRSAQGFNGSDLLQVLLACDMRYGDRDILHRHERAGGDGSLQFSVANMVEPGTFNLEDINTFRTPGVSFFMTLPGPDEPTEAFECMLETANCVVNNLDADLLDENHDPATPAMLDQLRERVRSVYVS